MPEVAANGTHATLVAWSKKIGEPVAVGDSLAEVETDKAVVDISAETAGVMGQILVQAGQEVEVGSPIAVILAHGEADADVEALLRPNGSTTLAANTAPAAPVLSTALTKEGVPAGQRLRASPLARRLAVQRGLDLSLVRGSGPGGRIVKIDVERIKVVAASQAATPAPATTVDTAVAAPASVAAGFAEVPHSSMRRTIARRLSESKATIPHFYLSAECRVERLLAVRAEINATARRKISVNDFIIRAVAVALREVPQANVGWTESAMRHYRQADVAVAVSTDKGLITPVVRAVEQKTLSQISAEVADMATRAREGKLRPDEYQGGSISVSNLGMFGVSEFSAIINPPQVAILAVGAAHQKPVVEDGELKVGTVMICTMSVDHRAIDGALAGQWLAAFRRAIEAPLSMLT
jgi:pyruvate dehydrogenase E2 component (dihydrolipoamide acetyltransferase)